MTRIPIVFAFDNNLVMPAAVCFFSLFYNADENTAYDLTVLHRHGTELDLKYINVVMAQYPRHTIRFIEVSDVFDKSFEIRGITTPTYYRLLIPILLPEYDKVLYSDVDVIFRSDLSAIYNIELNDNYFGGVRAIAELDPVLTKYYDDLGLDPAGIIYAGNLIINCKALRMNADKIKEFETEAQNNYKYQDLDVINLTCKNKIKFIGPEFCLTTDISKAISHNNPEISKIWSKQQIERAITNGLIHYNGQKPWRGYCINFDIWWEYYRKSPIFDQKFYFDFFNTKLDEYDRLPLLKRMKILARYFVYGRTI